MPKVSVIIPVYNTAPWLRRCLDSVCGQTLRDIEIIIIDDGSEDISIDIINEYCIKDNRIVFIKNTSNQGVSYCRNIGINNSSGEYISFIDSDDFIDQDFFENLYIKNNKYDIIKGDILMYDIKTNKTYRTDWNDLNDDIKINKAYFCCAFTSAIYNSNFLKSNHIYFPENRTYFEDPRFSIMSSIEASNINIVNNVYYYYTHSHKHNDNISILFDKTINKLSEINSLLSYINNKNITKIDYIIYCAFLYYHINDIPQQILNNITKLKNISYELALFYKKCKFLKDVIELSYIYHKKRYIRRHAQNIRKMFLNQNNDKG